MAEQAPVAAPVATPEEAPAAAPAVAPVEAPVESPVDRHEETLATLAENPVQVDDTLDEADSAYNASEASRSYMSSLNSSIMNYKYENGRRYHAFREGTYILPNDDEEQDRMDMVHHIYSLLQGGKLYMAPLGDHIQRVLDIGTGTGIWAIDFADEHPSAEVIGTDLSPIQPKWTPPNCIFEVDDFEAEWLYRKPFSYIHARELEGCIPAGNRLFDQAFQHLESGGYFEISGVYGKFMSDDDTISMASDAVRWMTELCRGGTKFGKPIDGAPDWKGLLKDAGFVDVEEKILKIPIGPWPKDPLLKEIGRFQAIQELQVIDSYTPAIFTRVLGWDEKEMQVLMAKCKRNLRDPSIHLYLPVYFVWGRKP